MNNLNHLFKSVGKGVSISDKISVYGGDKIEIGDNVRIDDFCILSGGSGLKIGSHIHIAAYVSMFAGSGIQIGDFCQFGAYTLLLSESDDFSGDSLIGPQTPMEYKPGYKKGKPIILEDHVTFGSKCTVMPGVTLREGCIFGAHSLITKDCEPWSIYAGTPVRLLKARNKTMREYGQEFIKERADASPMVSISCLTYNHEAFIRDALYGFIMQKVNFAFEVIVHDDASTDKTPEIIREYQAKYPDIIKPVFQKENQFSKTGIYPMKHVYNRMRGKYIAECDGDDYWTDPLKLQKQVDFLEVNPSYVMCHHPYEIKTESQGILKPPGVGKDYTQNELIAYSLAGYGICDCTKMCRNFYNDNKKDYIDFIGDYTMNVLMGTFGKCKFIKDIGPAIYRKHPNNSWSKLPANEIQRLTKEAYIRVYNLIKTKNVPEWTALREPFIDDAYTEERGARMPGNSTTPPIRPIPRERVVLPPSPPRGVNRNIRSGVRIMPPNWR